MECPYFNALHEHCGNRRCRIRQDLLECCDDCDHCPVIDQCAGDPRLLEPPTRKRHRRRPEPLSSTIIGVLHPGPGAPGA